MTLIYLPGLFGTGAAPQRLGSAHPEFFPNQAFQAGDGKWLNSGASDQRMWRGFCKALERTDLTDDPHFATNADRRTNREELIALLRPIFKTRSRADWLAVLRENNVPSSAINDVAEAMASPQAQHRNMHRKIAAPGSGRDGYGGTAGDLLCDARFGPAPAAAIGRAYRGGSARGGLDDEAIARLTQPNRLRPLPASLPLINAWSRMSSAPARLDDTLKSGKFVLTAEITPPVSCDKNDLLEKALPLRGLADAVNVTDGAGARAHMDSVTAATSC